MVDRNLDTTAPQSKLTHEEQRTAAALLSDSRPSRETEHRASQDNELNLVSLMRGDQTNSKGKQSDYIVIGMKGDGTPVYSNPRDRVFTKENAREIAKEVAKGGRIDNPRIRELLEQSMRLEIQDKFVNAINDNLKRMGSQYRVNQTSRQVSDYKHEPGVYQITRPYDIESRFSVSSGKTNQETDSLNLSQQKPEWLLPQ